MKLNAVTGAEYDSAAHLASDAVLAGGLENDGLAHRKDGAC